MRPLIAFFLSFCGLCGRTTSQPPASPSRFTVEEIKKRIASYPSDEQVYELRRFWLVVQAPAVQKLFDQESTKPRGFALCEERLQAEGDTAAKIDRRLHIIDKDGERWEVERWNRVLTSNSPSINWQPNAFLVQMVEGRKPARALDVGMGQGRNALWLAEQGWETTGYDAAEKAVALAKQMVAKSGVKVNAVIAKDSEFDMGAAKWDLILLSYVEIRNNAERVIRVLAPGGIVVVEYFHQDSGSAPGGFADNELKRLFETLRAIRYEEHRRPSGFPDGPYPPGTSLRRKTPLARATSFTGLLEEVSQCEA
jgi:predicted O-methyltransferase YrrM